MPRFIAALPMYDWPERRAEVDAQWARLRDRLRSAGVADAPDRLVRRNADMPPVPGGIRDSEGRVIAPDPAELAPDELDLPTLWRHPALLFSQTCWGPMEAGDLARHVEVVGQQDYEGVPGGRAELYSSPLVVAARNVPDADADAEPVPPPVDGAAKLPLDDLRGKRLAFNATDSMSGFLGLERDLRSLGEDLDLFFSPERLESGGHRHSVIAVAEGRADVAAIDCMSWQLAQRFEPAAADGALTVVGWTARRRGLPFIASRLVPPQIVRSVILELEALAL